MHLLMVSSLDIYEFFIQCKLSDLKAESNWILREEVLSTWLTKMWFLDSKGGIAWEVVRNSDSLVLLTLTKLESAF